MNDCAWRRKLCPFISKYICIVLMSQNEAVICRHVTMSEKRTVRHRTRPEAYMAHASSNVAHPVAAQPTQKNIMSIHPSATIRR